MTIGKQKLLEILDNFKHLRALVIGDVMIDSYIIGKVDRISPEAPVPVVDVRQRDKRPGGAANVALNIKSLGAEAILACVVGKDQEAEIFKELIENNGIDSSGLIFDPERPTTVKTRIIGNKTQLLRVDDEDDKYISKEIKEQLILRIKRILDGQKIDVVIFEDYDKGVIDAELIEAVVSMAHERNIPVTADPKKRNFMHYKNVDLFKPNLKETREGLAKDIKVTSSYDQTTEAAFELCEKLNAKNCLITLSEHGMVATSKTGSKSWCSALANSAVVDVSGAGDTVIALMSLCYAQYPSVHDFTYLANIAAGLVCREVGVVPIDKSRLYFELDKHFSS
jgi:rfaE bifunctional protein kinase chain/domain